MLYPTPPYVEAGYESEEEYYKHKLSLLRNHAKNQIFINAALCDYVTETQVKLVIAKEKRRFLTEKLYHIRAQLEMDNQLQTSKPTQQLVVSPQQLFTSSFEEENGRRVNINFPRFVTDDESIKPSKKKSKLKKLPANAGSSKGKKLTESPAQHSALPYARPEPDVITDRAFHVVKNGTRMIPMNDEGMPRFPLSIGGLTIHSLGIVEGSVETYRENIGFRSSRVYASMRNVNSKCVYTCKIVDSGDVRSFEIEYEDYDDVGISLAGMSANECVSKLMQNVNKAIGLQVVPTRNLGEKFFGLSHPAVQDIIKTLVQPKKNPDSRFVMAISLGPDEKLDETINFEALQNRIAYYNFDYENMDVAEEVLDSF